MEEISRDRDQIKNEYEKLSEDMRERVRVSEERKAKFIVLQNKYKESEADLWDRIGRLEAENQETKLKLERNVDLVLDTQEVSHKLTVLENELNNHKLELSVKNTIINNVSQVNLN